MSHFARVLGCLLLTVTVGCAGAAPAPSEQPEEPPTSQTSSDPAGHEPESETSAPSGAEPVDGTCPPGQVAVPAGAHCERCGPLDGCEASPATCRPECGSQADCANGGCNTQLGACVVLCG